MNPTSILRGTDMLAVADVVKRGVAYTCTTSSESVPTYSPLLATVTVTVTAEERFIASVLDTVDCDTFSAEYENVEYLQRDNVTSIFAWHISSDSLKL